MTKSFLVLQALKGFRKRGGPPGLQRPVSYELLEGLCQRVGTVCSSSYEARLFKAAFSLAFFGAFRISELVVSNKKNGRGFVVFRCSGVRGGFGLLVETV